MLKEFKAELVKQNLTLIGDYVGLKLLKYSKRTIIFHSIVENNSLENCLPIFDSYSFYQKYGLYISPFDKLSRNINSFIPFAKMLKELFNEISNSHIANEEEGSIFHIIEKNKSGKYSTLITFKVYTSEMTFFKKLYENLFLLTDQLSKKSLQQIQGSVMGIKDFVEIVLNDVGRLPMDLNFYKTLCEETYQFCTNNIETIANNKVKLVSIIEMSILETEKKLNVKFPGLNSLVLSNQRINFKAESVLHFRNDDSDSNNNNQNTEYESKRKEKTGSSNLGSLIVDRQSSSPQFREHDQKEISFQPSTFKKSPIPNSVAKGKGQKNSPFKVVGSSMNTLKKQAAEKGQDDKIAMKDNNNNQLQQKVITQITQINNQFNYNFPNIAVNSENKDEIKVNLIVKHIDNPSEEGAKKVSVSNEDSKPLLKKNSLTRRDNFGTPIVKGGKKHRVVHADIIGKSGSRYLNVVNVESFKKDNILNTFSDKNNKVSCCIVI